MKIYMALICKVGTPRKVLRELLTLKVPRGDIFLLFGPLDILIEFRELKNLNEYIQRWLNPIRMIGKDEGLIVKTLTLIVGQEGPSIREIPFAVVFLNTRPPKLEDVRRGIMSVPEALSADSVFGPYDVVCPIRAKDMRDLERVVLCIQTSVLGIESTLTCLVKEVY